MTPRCAECPHLDTMKREGDRHYCWGQLRWHHPNERVSDCKYRFQQFGFVANVSETFHKRHGLGDARRTEKLSDKLLRRTGFRFVQSIGHWCPACSTMHDLSVILPFPGGSRYTWNQDLDRATFHPDNLIETVAAGGEFCRCHYSIERGMIHYLEDCTHGFSGHLIPLPLIPNEVWEEAGIQ